MWNKSWRGNSCNWNVSASQGLWQSWLPGSVLMHHTNVKVPAEAGICLQWVEILDTENVTRFEHWGFWAEIMCQTQAMCQGSITTLQEALRLGGEGNNNLLIMPLVNSAVTTLAVFFLDTREIFCNNGKASCISKLRSEGHSYAWITSEVLRGQPNPKFTVLVWVCLPTSLHVSHTRPSRAK